MRNILIAAASSVVFASDASAVEFKVDRKHTYPSSKSRSKRSQ